MSVRKGKCLNCGKCCKANYLWERITKEFKIDLMNRDIKQYTVMKAMADLELDCAYLFRNADGTTKCLIYKERPEICRKYPPDRGSRMEKCGYYFEGD